MTELTRDEVWALNRKRGRYLSLKTPADDSDQAVYFIATKGMPFVKIGWVLRGAKIANRVMELHCGNPFELELRFLLRVRDKMAERRVHTRFAEQHHVREWFRITGELEQFLTLAEVAPDAAEKWLQPIVRPTFA